MQTPPGPPSPTSSSSAAASAAFEVDRAIWRAVAGDTVRIPAVNSNIYYYPQGHLEQYSASAAVNNYNFTLTRPWILCQVVSLRFLSDPASDQVFSKILLQPLQQLGARPSRDDGIADGADDDDDVVSFAKILTRSDVKYSAFSMPLSCADMVLPQLNFAADPPVQNLVMRDFQNNAWEFRHIYRGRPRRSQHLLTTGWGKYVKAKRLIAGDSVVFMRKKSTNELFVEVRRAESFAGDAGVDGAEALSAIENAVRGMPFEVVYFPKVGFPDFVVMAGNVMPAQQMQGMRVRVAVETDVSSQMMWMQGEMTRVATPANGQWSGFPWRKQTERVDDVAEEEDEESTIVDLTEEEKEESTIVDPTEEEDDSFSDARDFIEDDPAGTNEKEKGVRFPCSIL